MPQRETVKNKKNLFLFLPNNLRLYSIIVPAQRQLWPETKGRPAAVTSVGICGMVGSLCDSCESVTYLFNGDVTYRKSFRIPFMINNLPKAQNIARYPSQATFNGLSTAIRVVSTTTSLSLSAHLCLSLHSSTIRRVFLRLSKWIRWNVNSIAYPSAFWACVLK